MTEVLAVARGLVEIAMTRSPVRGRDGVHRPGCLYCGGLESRHAGDCAGQAFLDEAEGFDRSLATTKGPAGGGAYTWNPKESRVEKIR